MIISLYLKNNDKFNYYLVKEKLDYLACLISGIENLDDKGNNNENKNTFIKILYNLFSPEYTHLELNLLLADDNNNNNSKNILINFYNSKKEEKENIDIEEKKCQKIVEFLFDFDSKEFLEFNIKKVMDIDERFYIQLDIVNNILLILFSKEKYKYLKDENEIFYEYEFLNKVILKNILATKKANGDRYKDLFRTENLTNDIIKYIFFIFGNQMLVECLVKPLNIILNITGINNEFEIINEKGKSLNMERDITKNEFNILFDKILEILNENIPYFFKIFLKMIYDNVLQNFTIEKDNYIPLGVVLIFNYIASPRIQKIFSIHPHKYTFIKSMNRLLCNTCFNIEFGAKDPLSIFNEDIKIYNNKLNQFFQNNVINIDVNDVQNKKYLKNLFSNMDIDYPSFLFKLNCDYLEKKLNVDNNNN